MTPGVRDWTTDETAQHRRAAKARTLEAWCWDHHLSGDDITRLPQAELARIARSAGVRPPGHGSPTWALVTQRLTARAAWAQAHPGDPRSARARQRPEWIGTPRAGGTHHSDVPARPLDGAVIGKHLAWLAAIEPAQRPDGLDDGPREAVLCVGGPLSGQSFTVTAWRERRTAAARLTAIDSLPRAPLSYAVGAPVEATHGALIGWHVTELRWSSMAGTRFRDAAERVDGVAEAP